MNELELIENDIEAFLAQNEAKELLRFVTVGSVDDGKSTLIGRLLHDTKGVYDDQLKDATRTTATGEQAIDFARITDGLKAEREQGITIDVAYRYFSTPVRKFIIADTPGHVQYTRNMATGASTADVAIILIDARYGVLKQSRRHAYIASLLGIEHLLVCVNKMDLVNYEPSVFETIRDDFRSFANNLAFGRSAQKRVRGARQCAGFASVTFIPISALTGVNIVERSEERTPWYSGCTVLNYLETVEIAQSLDKQNFRFPVQYVLRPDLNYRGYAGQVVGGKVSKGDEVIVLPSGKKSRIAGIDTYDGSMESAAPPLSVVLRLEDEIDVSRGDLIVHPGNDSYYSRSFSAMVVWMSETPLYCDKSYVLKHGARYVRTSIHSVSWQVVLDTLESEPSKNKLELNEIGMVEFTAHQPIVYDPYRRNRHTGAFIIIDSLTNNTVGAGMIVEPEERDDASSVGDVRAEAQIGASERQGALKQCGVTLALVGRAASGRSSLAFGLERRLFDLGYWSMVIDPADARYADQGPLDRQQTANLARRANDVGLIAITTIDLNSTADRSELQQTLGDDLHTVHVATPETRCAEWDDHGRYPEVSGQFQAPGKSLIEVNLAESELESAIQSIVEALVAQKILTE